MKTFQTIAFIGLAIGLASAGPLDRNSGQSTCDIKCLPENSKVRFQTGDVYTYMYKTKTETALEQTSHEKSTIHITAQVKLHALDTCRFALEVNDVGMEEELSGERRQVSQGNEELSRQLKAHGLVFNMENGLVTRMCPSEGETPAALNIKRGIISMIQNSMSGDSSNEGITQDRDVSGRCPTRYSVSGETGKWEYRREKNLINCERQDGRQHVTAIAIPSKLARSSSLVNGTQQCKQIFRNFVPVSVECTERHVVRPFRRQEKAAATEITQELLLKEKVPSIAKESSFPKGAPQTIEFDIRGELESNQVALEKRLVEYLAKANEVQRKDVKEVTAQFSKLVDVIRQMDLQMLEKAVGSSQDKMLIDAVLSSMSSDSIRIVTKLIKQGRISDSDAKIWFLRAAFLTDVDVSVIDDMMPLLEKESMVMEAHLAISSLMRTHMDANFGNDSKQLDLLIKKLENDVYQSNSEDKLLAVFKALGNIGVVSKQNLILEKSRPHSLSTRLAAVETFRKLPCSGVDRRELWKLFSETNQEPEIRIAAYLNSIKCPTDAMMMSLKTILEKEPRESQLASFVYTHVKNLAKRSSWTHNVESIISDENLKHFDLDSEKFSKNLHYEMFVDPLDLGFEIESGLIMSRDGNTMMLNATFDIFGQSVNLFDARVRVQRDLSSFDGFLRFFGNEVMYRRADSNKIREMQSMLKSVMSTNGLQINRSMVILDTKLIVPTGNGLPLIVAIKATSTLDLNLKAQPLDGRKNVVADAQASPSAALQFEVSMKVKAPKAESGISMIAKTSSQWSIEGRIKMDLSAPAMFKIELKTPRERSEIINVESNVFLESSQKQKLLEAGKVERKEFNMCTGDMIHKVLGHKLCLKASLPLAYGEEAPMFLFRGNGRLGIELLKTDKTLNEFQMEASMISKVGQSDEMVLSVNTPGSGIDRHFKGRLYNNQQDKSFGLELLSPVKKITIEGRHSDDLVNRQVKIEMKVDQKPELTINAAVSRANRRTNIYVPSLQIILRNEQILDIKSEMTLLGDHGARGTFTIGSPLTRKPIEIKGQYSGNDGKQLTIGLTSEMIKANIDSRAVYGESGISVKAEGDFELQESGKHSFSLGGKLDRSLVEADFEMAVRRSNAVIVSANAKYSLRNPLTVESAINIQGKKYGVKLDHSSEARDNSIRAIVEMDSQKYTGSIQYALGVSRSKLDAKIELPGGVEKNVKSGFFRNNNAVKVTFMTDLHSKPMSLAVSYVPKGNWYKLNGDASFAGENLQFTGMMNIDGVYQLKFDANRNQSQLINIALALSNDITKPSVKTSVTFLQKLVLDVTSEAVFDTRGASVLFHMRAPVSINGNAAVKNTGSLGTELKLETNAALKSQDQAIDFDISSTAELSLNEHIKKVNIDLAVIVPRGTHKLVLKNRFGSDRWNIGWQLDSPDMITRKALSSGTFTHLNNDWSNGKLRGSFEMDVEFSGFKILVEPITISADYNLRSRNLDMKVSITKNDQTMVDFDGKANLSGASQKSMSVEARVVDHSVSAEWSLDGSGLENGLKTSLRAKWNRNEIRMNGEVRESDQVSTLKLNIETPFKKFSVGKMYLQKSRVSPNTNLFTTGITFGEHSMSGELTLFPKSVEIIVRSSIQSWEKVRANASWETKPHMSLSIAVDTPKYPGNVAEIRIQTQNNMQMNARFAIPYLHAEQLIEVEGDLDHQRSDATRKGKLNIKYKTQHLMNIEYELEQSSSTNRLRAEAAHSLRGKLQNFKLEASLKKSEQKAFDIRVIVVDDKDRIIDISHILVFNVQENLHFENTVDAKGRLFSEWQGFWLKNSVMFSGRSVRFQHEIGRSPSDIIGSFITVFTPSAGTDKERSTDLEIRGKWLHLDGAFFGKLSTDARGTMKLVTNVKAQKALQMSSELGLRLLADDFAAWATVELPTIEKVLKSKISFAADPTDLLIDLSFERRNDSRKKAALRLSKSQEALAFSLLVPEEFERKVVALDLQKTGSDASSKFVFESDDSSLLAASKASMRAPHGLSIEIKKGTRDIVKLNLSLEKYSREALKLVGDLKFGEKTYNGELNGELSDKTVSFLANVGANHWQKRSTLSFDLSSNTNSLRLKVYHEDSKIDIGAKALNGFVMNVNVQHASEIVLYIEGMFNRPTKDGSIDIEWGNDKKQTIGVKVILDILSGELKMRLGSTMFESSWSLQGKTLDVNVKYSNSPASWKYSAKLDWESKYFGRFSFSSNEYNSYSVEASLKPERRGLLEFSVTDNAGKMMNLSGQWSPENIVLDFGLPKSENLKININAVFGRTGSINVSVNSKGQQISSYSGNWAFNSKFIVDSVLTLEGKKHEMHVRGDIDAESVKLDVNANCHWISLQPVKVSLLGRAAPNIHSVETEILVNGQVEVNGNVKIEGTKINGAVRTQGQVIPSIDMKLQGFVKNDEFQVDIQTSKWSNMVISGAIKRNENKIVLIVKTPGTVYSSEIYYKNNYGFRYEISQGSAHGTKIQFIRSDKQVTIECMLNSGNEPSTFKFEHTKDNNGITQLLKIGKVEYLGYQIRLQKNIFGSSVRVDMPNRALHFQLDQGVSTASKKAYTGVFSWDYARDQQKNIKITMTTPLQRNSKFEASVEMPKINQKLSMTVAQQPDGILMEVFNTEKVFAQLDVTGERLQAAIGELRIDGEYSKKASKIRISQIWSQIPDVDLGYEIVGKNTLQVSTHWRPQMGANIKMAFKKLMSEVREQLSPAHMEFLMSEVQSFSENLERIKQFFNDLYREDAMAIRTIWLYVERMTETYTKAFWQWMKAIENKMAGLFGKSQKLYSRYSERLSLASRVVQTIYNEMLEDAYDSILDMLNSCGKMYVDWLQKIIGSFSLDAMKMVTDKYLCEVNSHDVHLDNKQCGIAYALSANKRQNGIVMRMPTGLSY